LEQQHRNTYK